MGAFAECQPAYAAAGICTFPVVVTPDGDKHPAIRGWANVGAIASEVLARKFPDADGLGFCPGKRSGVTVLDVDSADERVLADAMSRHGESPLVVKTARARFQAYYRHQGELRKIRPFGPDVPIDILGQGGFTVAAPTVAGRSRYQIVQGSLDDLERLPSLNGLNDAAAPLIAEGSRNHTLFRLLCKRAASCSSFDELLTLARGEAASYAPPMADDEVIKTARSVWRYKQRGTLRVGERGAWLEIEMLGALLDAPHACTLFAYLKAQNGPDAKFWIADGLGEQFGWSRRELPEARRRLVEKGMVTLVRGRAPGRPALFEWGRLPGTLADNGREDK